MAAKGSGELAGGAASLPASQEANLAVQYSKMDINGGKIREEMEISGLVSRFASQRDREERLAAIAAHLRRMKEKRGSRAPTFVELAAFVLLRESAELALEGLPTTLVPQPLSN